MKPRLNIDRLIQEGFRALAAQPKARRHVTQSWTKGPIVQIYWSPLGSSLESDRMEIGRFQKLINRRTGGVRMARVDPTTEPSESIEFHGEYWRSFTRPLASEVSDEERARLSERFQELLKEVESMPRKPNIVPSDVLFVRIPAPLRARLDLHLWSEVENCVPKPARQKLIVQLLQDYLDRVSTKEPS